MKEYQIDKAKPAAPEVTLIAQKTRQLLACAPLTGLVLLHSLDNRFLSETSCSTPRAVPYHESHYCTLPCRSSRSSAARWRHRDHPGNLPELQPRGEAVTLNRNLPPEKLKKQMRKSEVTKTKDCDIYRDRILMPKKRGWKQLLYILISPWTAARPSVGGNPEKPFWTRCCLWVQKFNLPHFSCCHVKLETFLWRKIKSGML